MQETVLSFFFEYPKFALLISIIINVVISVLGFIPSFFLTAANILFFGFWKGTFISFIGEAVGAIISFYIYRKGFKRFNNKIDHLKYPSLRKLIKVTGLEAFTLILAFRLFPFIPSGFVNIFAALGKMSVFIFVLASSLGKIPALLIESYTVHQVMNFTIQGKIILLVTSSFLFGYVLLKIKKRTH